MVRRRAAGGGRKPKGPIKGKKALLATRITPGMRRTLEWEARRRKWSLSQVIEVLLQEALGPKPSGKPRDWALDKPRNRALGYTVSRLAASIERETGESWRRDKFTFEEVKAAIDTFLFAFAPGGAMKVPPRIEHSARHQAASRRGQALRSGDIGASYARGLLMQMETMDIPEEKPSRTNYYADEFYRMPQLRRDLEFKPASTPS